MWGFGNTHTSIYIYIGTTVDKIRYYSRDRSITGRLYHQIYLAGKFHFGLSFFLFFKDKLN